MSLLTEEKQGNSAKVNWRHPGEMYQNDLQNKISCLDNKNSLEKKSWDEFVLSTPGGSYCHLSGWGNVIEKTYNHKSLYMKINENGNIKGCLPLIIMESKIFGKKAVSLPFLDYGGIIAENDFRTMEIYKEALNFLHIDKCESLDLRQTYPTPYQNTSDGEKVTFFLELHTDPEVVWNKMNGKGRNQIRKSQKSGISSEWVQNDGVTQFYEVFSQNMRDLGSPVHSIKFFWNIMAEFDEKVRILLIKKSGKVIGGGVCFIFKDCMIVPWASSLRNYRQYCPNNYFYWEAIKWGCQNGLNKFDFGRSSPGSGTYKFKKQWGAIEQPLHWHWVNGGHGDGNERVNKNQFLTAIQIWKKLPLSITKILGPILRRHISV